MRKATTKKISQKLSTGTLKLNLGCGTNKFPDFVNIDMVKKCKPDVVVDFRVQPLPYKSETVSEVWMCHVIEHIEKYYRPHIFTEINRVLKIGGRFVISFPHFERCVENYLKNANGMREFWEKTLFGRQLYKGDYHVAAIVPERIGREIAQYGFSGVLSTKESPNEPHNHLMAFDKTNNTVTQDDLVKELYK